MRLTLSRSGFAVLSATALALAPSALQAGTPSNPSQCVAGQPLKPFGIQTAYIKLMKTRTPFEYEGVKFWAPAPALTLKGLESKEWRRDYLFLNWKKLRDRQLLYAYYLTGLNPKNVSRILKAVTDATATYKSKGKQLCTAIGVEYNIDYIKALYENHGLKLQSDAEWLRRVAIPVAWSDKAYQLLKNAYDPWTFARLVDSTTTKQQLKTLTNYRAVVKGWSGSAKAWESEVATLMKQAAGTPSETIPLFTAAYDALSNGASKWRQQEPLASFVAVDRELDIDGIDSKPIVTSKTAWQLTVPK